MIIPVYELLEEMSRSFNEPVEVSVKKDSSNRLLELRFYFYSDRINFARTYTLAELKHERIGLDIINSFVQEIKDHRAHRAPLVRF